MNIFISYPHSDATLAENLATRLKAEGHDVFWDRTSLPTGESFDDRIRDGIEQSDLFICLVSKDSLNEGKYARTELKFAQHKWPNPSGVVLPVVLDDQAIESIPAYLKAITIKRPEGDPVAEILDDVRRIARRPIRRFWQITRVLGIMLVAAVAGWFIYKGLPDDPIHLTVGMSGEFYQESSHGDVQKLSPSTAYIKLLNKAEQGREFADGESLKNLLHEDEAAPIDDKASPLPLISFRINNNSEKTIVVDRLRLDVAESRINLGPLFWSSSTARHTTQVLNAAIELGNDGWGSATNVQYNFDIVAESALAAAGNNGQRQFSKTIVDIPEGKIARVLFWNELAEFGEDIVYLRDGRHQWDDDAARDRFNRDVAALKTKIGAQTQERIFTIGELSYNLNTGERKRLLLRQQLQIEYPGPVVAPAMYAAANYEIELKNEGNNYSVERSIAHSVPPGEPEAINLRVWVEKSSFHDMTAFIKVGEEWIQASDALKLEYYRPFYSQWGKGDQE